MLRVPPCIETAVAICYMLYADCHMSNLVCQLRMSDCYMPNAMTISMSLSMTTEQVGQSLYIFITRLLPLPRRDCYHAIVASIYISIHSYYSFADISWHRSKSPINVYFGLPTYQGINQYL
jgi:hypothetical protein